MEIIVGVTPEIPPDDALALSSRLAALLGAEVVVTSIHSPGIDYPSHAAVDAEWVAYASQRAEQAIDDALGRVRQMGTQAVGHLHPGRSESRGLQEVVEERHSAMVVVGSGQSGALGRIALGSTVNALLHISPVPVAVAPAGYADALPDAIGRLVIGFRATPNCQDVAKLGLEAAREVGLPVHLVTLVVVPTRVAGSRLGPDAEAPVIAAAMDQARAHQQAFLAEHPGVTGSVVEAHTVPEAMERFAWLPGDVMMIASSDAGPVRRVFLGSSTHRIIRSSPVPVIIVPREPANWGEWA